MRSVDTMNLSTSHNRRKFNQSGICLRFECVKIEFQMLLLFGETHRVAINMEIRFRFSCLLSAVIYAESRIGPNRIRRFVYCLHADNGVVCDGRRIVYPVHIEFSNDDQFEENSIFIRASLVSY